MPATSAQSERLSKRVVDAAQPGPAERFVWDNDLSGFGLRITPAGVKSFVFQYRMKGEKNARRYTIGRYGAWTPDGARERCKELVRMVERGDHPRDAAKARAAARAKERLDSAEREFSKIAERWVEAYKLDDHGKPRRPSSISLAKLATAKLTEQFRGRPIDAITRADLRAFFEAIPKSKAATRRNVYAYSRILWGFAAEAELISVNPFHSLKAPKPPARRDRWLEDAELALFWRASLKLDYPFAPFFRLLSLTGQRRSEVAGMQWQELDQSAKVWRIPGSRTKNHQPHIVPLSAAAVAEIASTSPKATWPKRGYVFTMTGKTPVSGISRAKSRLDAKMAEIAKKDGTEPPAEWRSHDLRRTVATGFQRLGVRFEVTEAVLNHVSGARGGVAGVYQTHDWAAEKREALDQWAAHVASLISTKSAADGAAKGGSPP